MKPGYKKLERTRTSKEIERFQHESGYRLQPGVCSYCDEHRTDSMMPRHTASERCESGRHNHCTCDTCY